MLLGFGVGGFLSFDPMQYVYFTPTQGARLKNTKYEENFHLQVEDRPMKSAILFGDNASGKTNWFYALATFCEMIHNGMIVIEEDVFHHQSNEIQFEILTRKEDTTFHYELSYTKNGYVKKEVFKMNDSFVFSFHDDNLKLGKNMGKFLTQKEDNTIMEILFSKPSTSTLLVKLKDFLIEPIDRFISSIKQIKINKETIINKEIKYVPVESLDEEDKNTLLKYDADVLSILQALDPTITSFQFQKIILEEKDGDRYEMGLTRGEEKIKYSLASESLGIKKMINLLPHFLKIYSGQTVLIDELDSSIGSTALIQLFNQFINSEKNGQGQMIISSHNLKLINLDLFHPSQLYVVSKGCDLSSYIHSIADYDYRTNKKGIDEMYMKGCFNVL